MTTKQLAPLQNSEAAQETMPGNPHSSFPPQSGVEFFHLESAVHNKHIASNNKNICLLKIDKPQLNTEMLKVKFIHTQ